MVTPGAPTALAAKAATSTIPIVFNQGIDPVQSGLVASFNRQGGNITGIELLTTELAGKRLELLREMLPTAAVVALLVNPGNTGNTEEEARSVQDAARARTARVYPARQHTERD
jgi:putative ABC transport system substrate-binding protein